MVKLHLKIEGEIALLHQCLKEEIITEAEYRKSVMLQLSKLVLLQSPRGSKLKLLTEMMQEGKITKPEMQMIGRQMLLSTGTETEREGTATLVPMVMSAQKAVYTVLREAEHRSVQPLPYWNLPGAKSLVPRQKKCVEALAVVNKSLDDLIAKCKKLVEEEDVEFVEEFLSKADPSILHFLLASGEQVSSKQLRDDLMTMLIAGHETTAAVLTWTFYLLATHPEVSEKLREEVDRVIGDRTPTIADMKDLAYTTRIINESMRLYPQPPVLLRRALEEDKFDNFVIPAGSDIFISVWNLHRSPALWEDADSFKPERFPITSPVPNETTENFSYLPFGGGKRKCIGDQFALFESVVALSMLNRRYDFTLDPNGPAVGMTTGATIHTTAGLFMHMTPRPVASLDRTISLRSSIDESAHSSGGSGGCPHMAAAAPASSAQRAVVTAATGSKP